MTNIYRRIRDLLPDSPVLIGRVLEHHEDDTSTLAMIGIGSVTPIEGQMQIGATFRARGTHVAVGQNAFVRRGVIETTAPGGDPEQVVVGIITAPPDFVLELPPLNTRDFFTGSGPLVNGSLAEETDNEGTWFRVDLGTDMMVRSGGSLIVPPRDPIEGYTQASRLAVNAVRSSPTGWRLKMGATPPPSGDGGFALYISGSDSTSGSDSVPMVFRIFFTWSAPGDATITIDWWPDSREGTQEVLFSNVLVPPGFMTGGNFAINFATGGVALILNEGSFPVSTITECAAMSRIQGHSVIVNQFSVNDDTEVLIDRIELEER